MVLLQYMFLVSLLFATNFADAEDLDALLTSLSAPKEAIPVAPSPVAESLPKEALPVEAPKELEPVEAPKEMQPIEAPKMPESIVEPKEAEPVIAAKISPAEPTLPKISAPVVQPVVPKVAVSPVFPKSAPTVSAPGVVAAPGAPKMVGVPTPVVAKVIDNQPVDAKVQLQITDVHDVVADGLNTLHIDSGGNWLEKRVWYKKAEQLFEDIRITIQKAADIRMKFVHEVNQVGQHIDEFYETVGFQKGQIEELLQAVLADLTTEEKIRGGDLSSNERSVRLKIHADQQQFQSMTSDFKLIEDLDDQVDKTMMKAFKEIDACRALETKAWNNFKDIGMELDDKKARVLYYEMENFQKNIEQKLNYLQTNLLNYLQSQLVTKVNQTTAQIKTAAQTLQSKGLALQTLLQKDSNGDFVILQKRDDAEAKAVSAKAATVRSEVGHESEDIPVKSKKTSTVTWYQALSDALVLYGCMAWTKLSEWFMIAACCVQTVLCKIQEMICHILGY